MNNAFSHRDQAQAAGRRKPQSFASLNPRLHVHVGSCIRLQIIEQKSMEIMLKYMGPHMGKSLLPAPKGCQLTHNLHKQHFKMSRVLSNLAATSTATLQTCHGHHRCQCASHSMPQPLLHSPVVRAACSDTLKSAKHQSTSSINVPPRGPFTQQV